MKEYNWPTQEIHFDKEEINQICTKTHPMLIEIARRHNVKNIDDTFGLPLPYMLAFDKVSLFYGENRGKYSKGYAEASMEVSKNDPWFYCHFLGDPVMPGSQGLDAFIQLAGLWGACTCELKGRGRALSGDYTYNGQIFPYSNRVYYRLDIIRLLKKKGIIFFDGHIAVDQPDNVIYTFKETKLGFFSKEDLSIPFEWCTDYYEPDWEAIKKSAIEHIEKSERFYKQHFQTRTINPQL